MISPSEWVSDHCQGDSKSFQLFITAIQLFQLFVYHILTEIGISLSYVLLGCYHIKLWRKLIVASLCKTLNRRARIFLKLLPTAPSPRMPSVHLFTVDEVS